MRFPAKLMSLRSLLEVATVCIAFALQASPGIAQAQTHVWQVEEDWELVLAQPDASTAGPQVTCTISPLGHISGLYGTFDINHRSAPNFQSGGVHLHLWNGESRLGTVTGGSSAVLATSGETISWKTIMTVESGVLTIDIDNGSSATWGAFGQGIIGSVVTTLSHLDQYSADLSAASSGVGFAGNRVHSLKLKKVTLNRTDGTSVEDNTERVVHWVE
jgi:hypothetical protein